MEHDPLELILILLMLSVIAVTTLRRLNLSPILGYLAVGIITGPYAFGWLPFNGTIQILAEIGVVFLLFTIGLEFSFARLIAMKDIVFKLGATQVIVSTLSGGAVALLLGIPWQGALIVGGALAMSSTAIVIKQLNEQMEMRSNHCCIAVGILLFQDLAVAPFLVIIPILASEANQSLLLSLLGALANGCLAFLIMFSIGRWGLRPLFHLVSTKRSAELFTLTALLVTLMAAWLTHLLDLSLTLGAFLAGMMLGETEYRHQVEIDFDLFVTF